MKRIATLKVCFSVLLLAVLAGSYATSAIAMPGLPFLTDCPSAPCSRFIMLERKVDTCTRIYSDFSTETCEVWIQWDWSNPDAPYCYRNCQ